MTAMKLFPVFILLLSVALLSGTTSQGDGAFDAQINTLKSECKALLKGARYEGSKITYYVPSKSKQTKTVEVYMLVTGQYVYALSTKKCSLPLTVKLYDAAASVEERVMLKEYKNCQGKNFTFNSNELNKLYRKKKPEVERLKNLHIEYSIGSGSGSKEALVLVMGRK